MRRSIDPARVSARPVGHHRRIPAALLVGLVVLAACGDDDSSSTDDTAVDTSEPQPSEPSDGSTGVETSEPPEQSGPEGTGEPERDGGEGAEVVVGAVLEPTSLDIVHQAGAALDQILLDNVYETLLVVDENGTIQPGLAATTEVSADGTVYTFTLQEGVEFHDRHPLTSADVVWSLEALSAEDAVGAEDLA
ncbi:MAG TPA: ABC transporter substrate-binding protein, partial [Ilumatobacteraceae bacterium]|nr:ABC transporter substrate-binding protein [Ilumatobacteraceae bacterium]